MNVFVDTSALYAVLDADDDNHSSASAEWQRLLLDSSQLVTTNYVLVETTALMQHRLGVEAVRTFEQDVCPILGVEWIDEARHASGMASVLAAGRRHLSLVDCVSFAVLRDLGLRDVFAFDEHFAEQGFTCLPSGSSPAMNASVKQREAPSSIGTTRPFSALPVSGKSGSRSAWASSSLRRIGLRRSVRNEHQFHRLAAG